MSLRDISEKYNVGISTVEDINYGSKQKYRDPNQIYPLREKYFTPTKKLRVIGKNNSSGVMGVWWRINDNKWSASIQSNNKLYHLGNYSDKDDAIRARLNKELELFGLEKAPQKHLFEEYGITQQTDCEVKE